MDDKRIMEDLLNVEKGACGLYFHGTVESSSTNVHQTFDSALDDSLTMQSDIYQKMSTRGWYPSEKVEQQKLTKVKNQFAGM